MSMTLTLDLTLTRTAEGLVATGATDGGRKYDGATAEEGAPLVVIVDTSVPYFEVAAKNADGTLVYVSDVLDAQLGGEIAYLTGVDVPTGLRAYALAYAAASR